MFLPNKMDETFKNELLIDTCPQEYDNDADFGLLSLEETREALANLTRVQKDAAMDIVFDKYCINP
jgi:hypothetical protein